jgi:signal transduction histidine kinase
MVHGNPSDLEAMAVNLVSNAVKFTKDGGWVNCELRQIAGSARVEVSDNGLGIPRAEQRDLFTRFFRSTTAQEHAIQGTGLGLTIVDSIVQAHGGDISVESDHLEGSTFTVNLPLA